MNINSIWKNFSETLQPYVENAQGFLSSLPIQLPKWGEFRPLTILTPGRVCVLTLLVAVTALCVRFKITPHKISNWAKGFFPKNRSDTPTQLNPQTSNSLQDTTEKLNNQIRELQEKQRQLELSKNDNLDELKSKNENTENLLQKEKSNYAVLREKTELVISELKSQLEKAQEAYKKALEICKKDIQGVEDKKKTEYDSLDSLYEATKKSLQNEKLENTNLQEKIFNLKKELEDTQKKLQELESFQQPQKDIEKQTEEPRQQSEKNLTSSSEKKSKKKQTENRLIAKLKKEVKDSQKKIKELESQLKTRAILPPLSLGKTISRNDGIKSPRTTYRKEEKNRPDTPRIINNIDLSIYEKKKV